VERPFSRAERPGRITSRTEFLSPAGKYPIRANDSWDGHDGHPLGHAGQNLNDSRLRVSAFLLIDPYGSNSSTTNVRRRQRPFATAVNQAQKSLISVSQGRDSPLWTKRWSRRHNLGVVVGRRTWDVRQPSAWPVATIEKNRANLGEAVHGTVWLVAGTAASSLGYRRQLAVGGPGRLACPCAITSAATSNTPRLCACSSVLSSSGLSPDPARLRLMTFAP